MIQLVLDAFAEVVEEVNVANAKHLEQLSNAWSEANDKLPPTMDRHGRLHAPVDGYHLPTEYLDFNGCYDDVFFAKGQYLPVPLTGDDVLDYSLCQKSNRLAEKYMPRERIKVSETLADEIIAELDNNTYIDFKKGTSWEVNGIGICYLYMSAPSKAILNKFHKSVKDAIENKDVQQYSGTAIKGKNTVRGKIIHISCEDNPYTRQQYDLVYRVTVHLDNDSVCYGTLPKSIISAVIGDVIEFTATFEKSKNKDHVSYYKRPSKASIVENKS